MRCAVLCACLLTAPAAAQDPVWRIDPAAVTEIGAGSAAEDQLGRVLAATRLRDGSIAVLDALWSAVRVYAADGRHIRDIGRSGDGPGEFATPLAMRVVADTIIVLDDKVRRVRFAADGRPLRTDQTSLEGLFDARFNARVAGLLPDGSILVLGMERLFGRVRGEYRQRAGVVRLRRDGARDTIGWFAADSVRTDPKGVPVPRPYTPPGGLLWSAAAGRIFLATADRPLLRSSDLDGTRSSQGPIPVDRRRVSEADVAEAAAAVLRVGGTANDRRVISEWVEGLPRSARTPVIRSLVAVTADEVWLETWNRSGGRTEWLVMSSAGRVRARTLAPPGCRVLSVDRDIVLCLWRDAFDVERVRLHRLHRT